MITKNGTVQNKRSQYFISPYCDGVLLFSTELIFYTKTFLNCEKFISVTINEIVEFITLHSLSQLSIILPKYMMLIIVILLLFEIYVEILCIVFLY